jgi:hypothetical protein
MLLTDTRIIMDTTRHLLSVSVVVDFDFDVPILYNVLVVMYYCIL